MRKILLFILLFQNFISNAQGQEFSTIYLFSKDSKISVFINDVAIATVEYRQYLELKMYSEGKITLVIIDDDYKERWIKNYEISNGNNYYFQYSVKYGPKFEFNQIEETVWNTNILRAKGIQKYEEDKNKPLIQSNEKKLTKGPKQGTCFLLNKQGYLLTNYHVISDTKTIQIKGIGNDYTTLYAADLVAFDIDLDLALLKL